jgi:hypothetical protein
MKPRRYPHPLAIAAGLAMDLAALVCLVVFVGSLFFLAAGFQP